DVHADEPDHQPDHAGRAPSGVSHNAWKRAPLTCAAVGSVRLEFVQDRMITRGVGVPASGMNTRGTCREFVASCADPRSEYGARAAAQPAAVGAVPFSRT